MDCGKVMRAALGVILLVISCNAGGKGDGFKAEGFWIKDFYGRVIILRGVQIIKRRPPYLSWHTRDDILRLKSWGFNVVRFGIVWAAIESEPGKYNDEFLEEVRDRIRWIGEAGAWVILDMHQDLFSEKYGGDGAPEWACIDGGVEYEFKEPWFSNYYQEAVKRAFDNFWDDKEGVQTKFMEMWAYVVGRLKNEPNLIGYDLINEPWCGSRCGREFDRKILQPFYERLIRMLKEIDPSRLYFFEPTPLKDMGIRAYFEKMPLDGIVYAPHFYDPKVVAMGVYDGDISRVEGMMEETWEEEVMLMGIPWLVGEYGYMLDFIPENALEYMKDTLDLHDKFMIGSIYWAYDKDEGQGILWVDGTEKEVLNVLSRTYPQYIQGEPQKFKFDISTGEFSLVYKRDPQISMPTEIFVPQRHYPRGFTVSCSGCQFEIKRDKVLIWSKSERVEVKIKRRIDM